MNNEFHILKGGCKVKNKLLAVLFGTTLVLGACGGGDSDGDKKPEENAGGAEQTASINVDDAPVSTASCVSCHGGNFEGKSSNPSLVGVGSKYSEDEILDIIENGKGSMPGGMMKGEDAQKMAAWLAEQK